MRQVTFGEVRGILLGLGFQMQIVAGSYFLFQHEAASTRLVLEPFAEGDTVDPGTLAVVRRNLDERGIMPRAQFDALLKQRSLAGC